MWISDKLNNLESKLVNYILIIAIVLAPMTGLRIWKIGPAEGLLLVWCLLNIRYYKYIKYEDINFRFWLLFLFILTFGTGYAIIFYPIGSNPSGILTYFYLSFVSLGVYTTLIKKSGFEIKQILYKISIYSGLWYMFLYIYSLFISTSILGAPLWYGMQRFSGGGTNPHQIAVFLSVIIFISYYGFINVNSLGYKVIMLLNISSTVYLGMQTKSSTFILALVFTTVLLLVTELTNYFKQKNEKFILLTTLLILFLILIIIFFSEIYWLVLDWINSDPNGLGRFHLFYSVSLPFSKSPIFGLGPGTHAAGGVKELHNTYLEVLAMSGTMGIIVYAVYSYRIFKKLSYDYRLLFIILPLYIYGFAGFAMRRLVYWTTLMIILALSKRNSEEIFKK